MACEHEGMYPEALLHFRQTLSLRQSATTAGLLDESGVAHRALADARLTLETFRHLIGRLAPREPAEPIQDPDG